MLAESLSHRIFREAGMITLFLIATAVGAALFLHWFHNRRMEAMERRRTEPTCDFCGYIIKGLESPRCPECGRPIFHEPQDAS